MKSELLPATMLNNALIKTLQRCRTVRLTLLSVSAAATHRGVVIRQRVAVSRCQERVYAAASGRSSSVSDPVDQSFVVVQLGIRVVVSRDIRRRGGHRLRRARRRHTTCGIHRADDNRSTSGRIHVDGLFERDCCARDNRISTNRFSKVSVCVRERIRHDVMLLNARKQGAEYVGSKLTDCSQEVITGSRKMVELHAATNDAYVGLTISSVYKGAYAITQSKH